MTASGGALHYITPTHWTTTGANSIPAATATSESNQANLTNPLIISTDANDFDLTDFGLTQQSSAKYSGVTVAEVVTDFDTDTYSATPSMGAYALPEVDSTGVLLDTSPTEMRRAWPFPVNGMSGQLKATMNFNGADAKGADHALITYFFDATNFLEIAVDATNDQIHLNRSVGGVVGTASTTAAALGYVTGDELNFRWAADEDGLRLQVDAVTASDTAAASKADFTSAPTEIRINENSAGVTGVSIAAASDRVWNESLTDAQLNALT
jgi:hypothetical protein